MVIAISTVAFLKLLKGIKHKKTSIIIGILALILNLLDINELLLLFASGLTAMFVEYGNGIFKHLTKTTNVFALPLLFFFERALVAINNTKPELNSLGLFFLKIGSVLYGSGYVLIAFLQGDLVDSYHWMTSQQLLDAIAVGQFTPGPFLSTATFIGYIIGGIPGAAVSTLGIFLPSFVFVLMLVKFVDRLRSKKMSGQFWTD